MKRYKSWFMKGLAALVLILALGWLWGQRHSLSHRPPMLGATRPDAGRAERASVPPPGGRRVAQPAAVPDPVYALSIPPATRASLTQTAALFARDLMTAPPGGSSGAARCAALITPAFGAWLTNTPGAPVLAGAAAPVVVTGVVATVDDWAPGAASVAVGLSLHAGTTGPPAFLGMDVHLVEVAGHWLVGGMEL